jgi:hypothetical protein
MVEGGWREEARGVLAQGNHFGSSDLCSHEEIRQQGKTRFSASGREEWVGEQV